MLLMICHIIMKEVRRVFDDEESLRIDRNHRDLQAELMIITTKTIDASSLMLLLEKPRKITLFMPPLDFVSLQS
jgi:hypothetical protein